MTKARDCHTIRWVNYRQILSGAVQKFYSFNPLASPIIDEDSRMSFACLLTHGAAAVGVTIYLAAATPATAEPVPAATKDRPAKPDDDVREAQFTDNSTMKLKVLNEKLELVTKHGTLHIATADIQRIEFATRIPAEVAQKIARAISNLSHPDFKVREAATEELKSYRERAYQSLLKVQNSGRPRGEYPGRGDYQIHQEQSACGEFRVSRIRCRIHG